MEQDISKNIKKVFVVFLLFFVGIMTYIMYFELYKAPQVVQSQYNQRLWAIRNEVLRGTIYDKDMNVLSKSQRLSDDTQKRIYNGGAAFAHVLGYVDTKYGLTGLEKKYDEQLTGSDRIDLLDLIKNKGKTENKVGESVKTTLDSSVQKLAYNLLGDNRGAVVALNPKTGEVLALVSKPSFNPGNLEKDWKSILQNPENVLLNRATAGLYAPGSTFKTVTAVSALKNIKGIMSKTIVDRGKIVFNSKESLSNYKGEVLGRLNLKKAYAESSNVFFGTIGMELGNKNLKETAENFFFNKNIPSEGLTIENSRFPSYKSSEKGNIAQSAIGQAAVLATPMQMALIASTIANDGVMMKPTIVSSVLDDKGKEIKTIEKESLGTIIDKDNAKIMQELMRAVVTIGTGRSSAISSIHAAGKTGTADHDDVPGIYENPHSWYIGFAPYENPKVAVAVIVEEGGTGGKAAATIANKVMQAALK